MELERMKELREEINRKFLGHLELSLRYASAGDRTMLSDPEYGRLARIATIGDRLDTLITEKENG